MFRSPLLLVLVSLGCSRTPPESQGRDVATGVPHATAKTPSEVNSGVAQKASARQVTAAATSITPGVGAAPSATAEVAERPFRFPSAERIVAIGDLHGDL